MPITTSSLLITRKPGEAKRLQNVIPYQVLGFYRKTLEEYIHLSDTNNF